MSGIDRDLWLKAIAEADTRPPLVEDSKAVTVREFAQLAGCAYTTAVKRLSEMEQAGTVTRVTKIVIDQSSVPRRLRVTAFLLKEPHGTRRAAKRTHA